MLILLLALFQLALFLIGIVGPWRDAPELKNNGRLPRPIRMLLSLSLVVAAWVIWRGNASLPIYAQGVAFGMLASFLGDLIMARLIPLPNRLIGGMIAFGCAHILYVTAYVQTIQARYGEVFNQGLFLGLGFYIVIATFGWLGFIRNPDKDALTNFGALGYGTLIGVMASFALALAVDVGGKFWLTALGGLVFVLSDFIIGVTDIRGVQIRNANDWIWATYVLGQAGIIYAGS